MNRQEFKEKAKKTLDNVFAKIEKIENKSQNVSEKVKSEFNEEIAELKMEKARLEKKFHDLENSSEEQWEKSKAVFNESANSFKEGFEKLGKLINV